MFPLGHLGIGLKVASPLEKGLPRKIILLGTLLPDLLDKPLYYGQVLATGRRGLDLGLIAGTRSFGHTLILTAVLAGLASARKSKTLAALALGTATHLLLDLATDACQMGIDSPRLVSVSLKALLWPLLGWQFPPSLSPGIHDHLGRIYEPLIIAAEIAGAAILIWEWRKARRPAAA